MSSFSIPTNSTNQKTSTNSTNEINPTNKTNEVSSPPLKVLFIGNSYVYVNALPTLILGLVEANNHSLYYDSSTPGGARFSNHLQNSSTLSKINKTNWDYVVLQNQSQLPGWRPVDVSNSSLINAISLVNLIKSNHSLTTVLYFNTWGRRAGDNGNCSYYPLVCTFDGHTQALIEGYNIYLSHTGDEIAPVGLAWKNVVDDTNAPFDSSLLWSSDGSHPSIRGSYLAALVIYRRLFPTNSISNAYHSSLSDMDANYLQQIALDAF